MWTNLLNILIFILKVYRFCNAAKTKLENDQKQSMAV